MMRWRPSHRRERNDGISHAASVTRSNSFSMPVKTAFKLTLLQRSELTDSRQSIIKTLQKLQPDLTSAPDGVLLNRQPCTKALSSRSLHKLFKK